MKTLSEKKSPVRMASLFRSKRDEAQRAQLAEAGLPQFAIRLAAMRHLKFSAPEASPQRRHD